MINAGEQLLDGLFLRAAGTKDPTQANGKRNVNRKRLDLPVKLVFGTACETLSVAEDPMKRHLQEVEDELLRLRGRFLAEILVGGNCPDEQDVVKPASSFVLH